jgi:hypothetical protein
MARLITDEALRHRLTQMGIDNSLRYTWQNAAIKMWNCINRTVKTEPRC